MYLTYHYSLNFTLLERTADATSLIDVLLCLFHIHDTYNIRSNYARKILN